MSHVYMKKGSGPPRISVTLEVSAEDSDQLERLGRALGVLLEDDDEDRQELKRDLARAALSFRPFPAE